MVTVHKGPEVDRLPTRFGRVGRHRILHITVEVNPWCVIVEGFEINLMVSGIKDQACVMPLPQVGHSMQSYSNVSLSWRSKIGRQQGDLGAQINPSDFYAPLQDAN